MALELQNCTALITGASSGFGEAYAKKLAPLASNLIITARRKSRLTQLKKEILTLNKSCKVEIFPGDLANEDFFEKLIIHLAEKKLLPNLLINNAGLGDMGTFKNSNLDKIISIIDVNITALTKLCYYLLPAMIKMRSGGIINVSSLASLVPLPAVAVYAASKAYVTSFSEALHLEVKKHGIHVTAVCPGPVKTEFRQVAERKYNEDKKYTNNEVDFLRAEISDVIDESLKAIIKNYPRVYPGAKLKTAARFIELLPPYLQRPILKLRLK